MEPNSLSFSADISSIDSSELLQNWEWLIGGRGKGRVILITLLGDAFITREDDSIYWLQTDIGEFSKVAADSNSFNMLLSRKENIDLWFLPELIGSLKKANNTVTENQVYSFLQLPVMGGEYSVANIVPKNIMEHFAFTGYFFKEIKDLPDGTEIAFEVTE